MGKPSCRHQGFSHKAGYINRQYTYTCTYACSKLEPYRIREQPLIQVCPLNERDESSASLRTGHPSPGCLGNGVLPL
ncbi:hypothetical protein HDV57DRAFT_505288 [Trichoderma longibrachiatum]